MSLTHLTHPTRASAQANSYISSRAGIAARTLEDRLTGSAVAVGLASLMLVAVVFSSNDIHASTDMVKARIWNTVSAVVCGSHLNAFSHVGPGCGTVGR